MAGVKSTYLDTIVYAQELLANSASGTGRVSLADIAVQLASEGAIANSLNALEFNFDQVSTDAERAEAARDAAVAAGTASGAYSDTALADAITSGLAGTTDGEDFYATGADVDYIGLYANDGGSAAEYVDARLPKQSAIDSKVETLAFETLNPDAPFMALDQDGNVLFEDSGAQETAVDEVTAARGDAASLNERLSRGLTDYGDQIGPTLNDWTLRNCRRKLALRAAGDYSGLLNGSPDGQDQLIIGLAGDSWMTPFYWTGFFAKALQDKFGFAGAGFYGFQIAGSTSPVTYSETTLGNNRCARDDRVGRLKADGTWSAQNTGGGEANPSIGYLTSSEAGAWLQFTYQDHHDTVVLHYVGTGGVIRHSWDEGATWEANTTLSGTGPQAVTLSGVPTGAGKLRIEVVTAPATMAGTDLQANDAGVRVHTLGAGGANSDHWTAIDNDDWASTLDVLKCDALFFALGTNDQSAGLSPAAFQDNINEIFSAVRANNPATDLLWISPFENARSNAIPMTQYAQAARSAAVDGGWAFLDLQYVVGDDPDIYDYTVDHVGDPQVLENLGATAAHPSRPFGSMAITDAVTRLICPSF